MEMPPHQENKLIQKNPKYCLYCNLVLFYMEENNMSSQVFSLKGKNVSFTSKAVANCFQFPFKYRILCFLDGHINLLLYYSTN